MTVLKLLDYTVGLDAAYMYRVAQIKIPQQ